MALSMMVEKESGRIEGNEFENLWSKVTLRDGRVRYGSLISESCITLKSHRPFLRRYKNTVTGSIRADAPPLCLGGLLADVGSFSHHTSFTLPISQ